MRIRDRVRRLWRALEWLRPGRSHPIPEPLSDVLSPAAAPSSSPPVPSSRSTAPPDLAGEPLIGGAVTVRMWIVGGRLILASSTAEAERALVALLGELSAEERQAAHPVIEALREGRSAAA